MAASLLDRALGNVRRQFGDPTGLLTDLPADATWARARSGEFLECSFRLLELWAKRELGAIPAHEVLDHFAEVWPTLTDDQARSIELLADALWTDAMTFHPGDPGADRLLGELLYLRLPMIRWLDPWLSSLDGPGAKQLADSILRPSNSEAWKAKPDQRLQLETWAASEPVVMGLAVVGGVHLEEGDFADLLDRLV